MNAVEQVVLPTGQAVLVRPAAAAGGEGDGRGGPTDVGLAAAAAQPAQLAQVPGFVETVQAVAESVRLALQQHRPDTVEVQFGVELSAKTGPVLSILGEAGGTAHLKITASWGNRTEHGQGEHTPEVAGAAEG